MILLNLLSFTKFCNYFYRRYLRSWILNADLWCAYSYNWYSCRLILHCYSTACHDIRYLLMQKVICLAMKLLAYLFIYKAKRLPLFGKFMDMHIQTEERNRESKRVIGSKHLDIDNHFFFPNYVPHSCSNDYSILS